MKFGIIGLGRLGKTLLDGLINKNMIIGGLSTTNNDKHHQICLEKNLVVENSLKSTVANSDVIVVCVNDSKIKMIAEEIALLIDLKGKTFLHTSGASTSLLLEAISRNGGSIGSLHPLQTFSENTRYLALCRIYYFFEGDENALIVSQKIVNLFEGTLVIISRENKPLYHMCASIISNFNTAISYISEELFRKVNPKNGGNLAPFRPLMAKTMENIFEKGSRKSLTGPISRGDSDIVSLHLQELENHFPEFICAYKELGKIVLAIANNNKTLTGEESDVIARLLE
jgi:predicted short-subunit dehydrogenase-like oxidoreductase (DUF2520 family)